MSDARWPEAFAIEHFPTAVNIPHRMLPPETTADLNPAYLYATCFDDIGGNASTRGKLARLGFQVQELLGGLAWWRRDSYATEGTKAVEGRQLTCDC